MKIVCRNIDNTGSGKKRLLRLLGIYIVAIILGVVAAVLLPDMKIYGILFYAVILAGSIRHVRKEQYNYKEWFQRPDRNGIGWIVIATMIVLSEIGVAALLHLALWFVGELKPFEFDFCTCLASCCLAPVVEEVVCRGIIVDILKEKHGEIFVILVSALIFYVIHGEPTHIGTFIFGILSSWMVLKTKSIIPGIILHFLWNLGCYFLPWIVPFVGEFMRMLFD